MKVIKKIFEILLPICITCIMLSIGIDNIATKSLKEYILKDEVADIFIEPLTDSYDLDVLFKFKENISNNKNMNSITKKTLKEIVNTTIKKDTVSNIDFEENIQNIIKEELYGKINSSDEEKVYKYVNKKINKLNYIIESNVGFFEDDILFKIIIITYSIVTSILFRIVVVLILISSLVTICMYKNVNKYNVLFKCLLTSFIICIFIILSILLLSGRIEQYYSGGWIDNIDISIFIAFAIVELILSCIFKFIYKRKEESKC